MRFIISFFFTSMIYTKHSVKKQATLCISLSQTLPVEWRNGAMPLFVLLLGWRRENYSILKVKIEPPTVAFTTTRWVTITSIIRQSNKIITFKTWRLYFQFFLKWDLISLGKYWYLFLKLFFHLNKGKFIYDMKPGK